MRGRAPADDPICLFWGRLGPYVGLDETAEAILLVPDAALVRLGFGRGWERSVARDADPRFAGRHFTLPAVHPDELVAWVASADVAMVHAAAALVQPALHDPEQVPRGDGRRDADRARSGPADDGGLLEREDPGRVAASMAPADIAAAIRAILDLPPPTAPRGASGIAAMARERYSWPIAAEAYESVLRSLDQAAAESLVELAVARPVVRPRA